MRTGAEGSQRKGSSSDPGGDVSQGDEEGLVAVEIRTCQGARGPPKWLGLAGRRGWEGQQVRLGLGLGSPEAMLNLHLGKDMGPQLWAGRAAVGREGPGFRALSPRCSAVLGANPEGRGAKNLGGAQKTAWVRWGQGTPICNDSDWGGCLVRAVGVGGSVRACSSSCFTLHGDRGAGARGSSGRPPRLAVLCVPR